MENKILFKIISIFSIARVLSFGCCYGILENINSSSSNRTVFETDKFLMCITSLLNGLKETYKLFHFES